MNQAPESILGAEDGAAYRRFLEWSPGAGFDLAIIKVALPLKRDALIAWTREQIPAAMEIDLRQVGPDRSRLWDLLHVAAHDHGASMLILYGLEESAVRERLLAQFNVERDELVKAFALPWVLFVHPTVYPELMQKAPDFIDFAGVWLEEVHHETPALPKMEMPVARTEAAAGEMAIGAPEAKDPLIEAALAIAEWRLDEARDLLARYGLEHSGASPKDLDGIVARCLRTLVDNRLEDALRLLREDVLPTFEHLKPRRVATMMYVAEILRQRGELDEALQLLRGKVLPAFDRLGNARAHAVTLSYVADILLTRGDDDEAVRIRREEVLPVYEKLGDVRSLLLGRANLATTLANRGRPEDAPEAARLLALALADARRLHLAPEAHQIEATIRTVGLDPNAPPFM